MQISTTQDQCVDTQQGGRDLLSPALIGSRRCGSLEPIVYENLGGSAGIFRKHLSITGRHCMSGTSSRHFPVAQTHTLSELISRYQDDIQPRKTPDNQRREEYILGYWEKALGHCLLSDIHPRDIIQCRDTLGKTRTPGTVHRYLAVVSHLFSVAIRD